MDKIALSVNSLYEKYPYPSLPIRNEQDLVGKLHANVMSKILSTAGLEPSSLCKPGGTVTIGLYNRYGRLVHRAKRMWITLNAGEDIERRMSFVETLIYRRKLKNAHEQAYAADKYVNPYESYHSVGEVLGWFDKNGITYIGSHPRIEKGIICSWFSQLKWLIRRNGFFIISGRKN